jgi:deoxyadenosine/deoxycytidine kinase
MNNNILVSLEGNIGSGKTTLLEKLKKKYNNNKKIVFLKEPVDEWDKIRDENNKTILEKYYMDPTSYAFPFQMMAYISRLSLLRKAFHENQNSIIITERCLFTDKYVFAKMLFDTKKIDYINYQIYLNWFDEFSKDFPINYIIYVKTDPTICQERIKKRLRVGEDIIPLDYLISCHEYHEEFLHTNSNNNIIKVLNCNQLLLDGNIDIYNNKDILNEWEHKIELVMNHFNRV